MQSAELWKNKKGYAPLNIKEFKLYKGVESYCKIIKKLNYIIIITNQPDIARKKITNNQMQKMHIYLKKKINYDDIYIFALVYQKKIIIGNLIQAC